MFHLYLHRDFGGFLYDFRLYFVTEKYKVNELVSFTVGSKGHKKETAEELPRQFQSLCC